MRVLIVGASHAGIAAARRAREEYPDAQITMFERKKDISFVSQTIPLFLMGQEDILKQGNYTTVAELAQEGIEVLTETEVRAIDVKAKTLSYKQDRSKMLEILSYDKLIMASGSYPILPPTSGVFNKTFFLLKNFEDAMSINRFMGLANKVVVIGGGVIGTEISRIFALRGLSVTMVHSHDFLMNRYLDPLMSEQVELALKQEGVIILKNTRAIDYKTTKPSIFRKPKMSVFTSDGAEVETDGVVVSVGFRPNTYLLIGQVEFGDKGAILVDEYMRTTTPDVFAVGDCATTYLNLSKENVYIPHASDAIRQGNVAGVNLVTCQEKIPPSLGTYNLNMESFTIATTGLTKTSALAHHYDVDAAYYENRSINSDKYAKMYLVYEVGTKRILGFQVVSNLAIGEYANIFALAIQDEKTIDEIELTDFYFEHGYKNPSGFTKILAKIVRSQEEARTKK
ncbi:MAG: FAD-dependent oxidoreductase [Lactobacillales bacterium]|jgi:NADPH-dependent 2,4-dienoyl-CoA reductase/sulfur reductase-like enzyme|nr:FAD-dependent oxidoreductase [Lactobacillales bacterium]